MKKIITPAFLALGIILQPHLSQALVASPDLLGFDFRFSSPGARANAMGGAFIGLADDASAAYTNPAGLTVLTRSEVSVEYKYGTYTSQITDFADTNGEPETSLGEMGFVSYAYPQDRATITIFRHIMVDNKNEFIWHDPPSNRYHSLNTLKIKGMTYGLGLGYKLFDNLSVGLTVNSTQMEYNSNSTNYSEVTDPTSYNYSNHPEHIDGIQRTSGSDTDEHFTVSLLWNMLDELNLGLVYRQGPEYTFTYSSVHWDNDKGFSSEAPIDTELKVPDVYGIGLSYNLPFGLTIGADASLIKYSQLYGDLKWESQQEVVYTDPSGSSTSFYAKSYAVSNLMTSDDEWEYHVGLEYVFEIAATPVALRGGYYLRPAAALTYNGPAVTDPNDDNYSSYTNDWSRKDDNIYSAGLGFVIGENVQIDIAGMFGDFTTEGIFSLVYRLQ